MSNVIHEKQKLFKLVRAVREIDLGLLAHDVARRVAINAKQGVISWTKDKAAFEDYRAFVVAAIIFHEATKDILSVPKK